MSDTDWILAFQALFKVASPDEWGRIVNARRQVLLTPASLMSVQRALTDAQRAGEPVAVSIQVIYYFLRMANERGVAEAVAHETARRVAITHAGALYLSAGVWEAPDILTQYQTTLLTPDAMRVVRRMVAMADAQASDDQFAPVRQRISALKLALMADTSAHGSDLATRRYIEAMTALIEASSGG